LHSAKALPSATLGKGHSAKKLSAKSSLPSVIYRALDKSFAECRHSAKIENQKKSKKIKKSKNGKKGIFAGVLCPLNSICCSSFKIFRNIAASGILTQETSLLCV
jgi:hypothetical protein